MIHQRATRDWTVEGKDFLQMRPGRGKASGDQQVSPRDVVTENKAGRVIMLSAETQQFLIQALSHGKFAAVHTVARLAIENVEEFRGRAQLIPQFACTGEGIPGLRRGLDP